MIKFFALHDSDSELKKQGAFEIPLEKAKDYNEKGYGIFFTFNDFTGARRKCNLEKINFWACDIDEGTKEEQRKRIKSLLFAPSIVVESNKGYHCYWKAKEAIIDDYKQITQGIAYKLNADKACTDPLRLLRAPTFYHLKNPEKPFLVEIVETNKVSYTNSEMLYYFKIPKKKYKPIEYKGNKSQYIEPCNYEKYYQISRITVGNRNNRLYYIVRKMQDMGLSNYDIEYTVKTINSRLSNPLSENEVNLILRGRRIL